MSTQTVSIEQAVRISHCSNTGKEHACIGVCTISRDGIELNCSLCGKDEKVRVKTDGYAYLRAKSILEVAGLNLDRLNVETQERVIKEVRKDICPNCDTYHFREPYKDYFHCQCGWIYNGRGWKPSPETHLAQVLA